MPDAATGEEVSGLDPSGTVAWAEVRDVARRMVDDILRHLEGVREREAWLPVPAAVVERLKRPFSEEPTHLGAVIDEVRQCVLPFGPGGTNPRFWGWVTGTGTVTGVLAEALAATVNGPAGLFNDVTSEIERAVLDWTKQVMGFPLSSSGIITSGGSVANLIGLQVARERALPGVRDSGLPRSGGSPVVYASDQVHSSVHKALATLGLGRSALRVVPSDARFRLNPEALRRAIEADRREDAVPIAVVASAGTVNTGAVDPLDEIAEVCRSERIWLHVDGAIGALARLAPTPRALLGGITEADSLAFDFHKWLYVPYEAGCVLIRDADLHRETFTAPASYLDAVPRGLSGPSLRAGDLGVQLSRGFKALKVWMSLREAGIARYRGAIENNVHLARRLEHRISLTDGLQLLARTDLSIVCFRFFRSGRSPAILDRVNVELLMTVQEEGLAVLSHTRLRGCVALRCSITNHRTVEADLDELVRRLVPCGDEILGRID